MNAKRYIEYSLGSDINLGKLRQVVNDTEGMPDNAKVTLERIPGQLDAVYFHLIIEETYPRGNT